MIRYRKHLYTDITCKAQLVFLLCCKGATQFDIKVYYSSQVN